MYDEFLRLNQELQDAEVPTEGRYAYYFVYSWWRHPIKRFKQKRLLRWIESDNKKESSK